MQSFTRDPQIGFAIRQSEVVAGILLLIGWKIYPVFDSA